MRAVGRTSGFYANKSPFRRRAPKTETDAPHQRTWPLPQNGVATPYPANHRRPISVTQLNHPPPQECPIPFPPRAHPAWSRYESTGPSQSVRPPPPPPPLSSPVLFCPVHCFYQAFAALVVSASSPAHTLSNPLVPS